MHETQIKESFDGRAVQKTDEIQTQKYSIDWNKTYYLSPDANETLIDFDEDANFVIGGLIDRTVIKQASYAKAI